MEPADTLCESLFRWLENRKECAGKLEKLAQELKDVHQGSNIAQVFRASLPAVALASACPTSTAKEAGVSSSIFNKATELIKEDEKVGRSIQNLLRDLKDRCAEAPLGAHADEMDCEVTTQLMCALARRRNTPVSLDLLRDFNRATFFRHMTPGGLAAAEATRFICKALRLDHFPNITRSLKVSAKEMVKNIELIGIKAAEAGSRALGVIGLGICLYDLIVKSEELVKGNQVTEASEFLRDSAREILEGQQRLKEQLDAINEIIQKLFITKSFIENLGEYSLIMTENGQRIMAYIMETCTDVTVRSWLQGFTHQIEFVNLLGFVLERLTIPEDLTTPSRGHIDIVFVAHGSIVDQFMPAGVLVPTPNIRDTILYSPWNCAIDSNAAFAIAQGFIEVGHREVYNNRSTAYCEPDPLPRHWNSMRESRHDIPMILLSPLTPEEDACFFFDQLQSTGMDLVDRVFFPYLVPKDQVKAFGEIPLFMFILATSYILSTQDKTATVHLAACLSRKVSHLHENWRTQYAYTSDGTFMTVNMGNRNMNSVLYRAFRSLFDRNRR